MVETVEITRVNIRDILSVDVSVWMKHPDDWDFRPSLSLSGNLFAISDKISGDQLASVELSDEERESLEKDRSAELRIKFQVHGMHGRLKIINPIIADGKAKKLATVNWKTTQPVTFL
tara:strand:- start:952 stop:1305 length:354 start_codon:yes stop_codon:yes gene_type:complete